MYTVRRSGDRGHAMLGWLDSRHTFSFADYHDPRFIGFRTLRVINEDIIDGGAGFPTHPHRDMEIISYVVEGALAHRDTLGNSTTIRPGEVQHMSAGTGIQHSEYNPLPDTKCHLLQIWILPEVAGIPPRYGQIEFVDRLSPEGLTLVASKDGRDGSVPINQDADLYVAKPSAGQALHVPLRAGRHAWVQVVKGAVTVGEQAGKPGHTLAAGDAVAVSDEAEVAIVATSEAEILVFDLK